MEEKKDTVLVNGVEVPVSKEVRLAYQRPEWAEKKRKQKEWKCSFWVQSQEGGHFVRCKKKCTECEYYLQGNNPTGGTLSIEVMREDGVEVVDGSQDVEAIIVEDEARKEKIAAVRSALSKLENRDRWLIRAFYFEKHTQAEIASKLGITQPSVNKAIHKAVERLKKFL